MNFERDFEDWWTKYKLGRASILTKKDCRDAWHYIKDELQAENAKLRELLDKVQQFLSKGHNDVLFDEIEKVLKGKTDG